MTVFSDGSPEDFCKWYEQYVEVKEMMPLETAPKQIKVIHSILKDSYLETFNNHLEDAQQPEEEGEFNTLTEDDVEEALEKVTLTAFKNDHHAYRHQRRYMRYQLYFAASNFFVLLTQIEIVEHNVG